MAVEVRKAGDQIVVQDTELDGVDHGDPETRYTLRALTSETIRDLRRPYVKKTFSKQTHRLEEVPFTEAEADAFEADVLDYLIVGWEGIVYQGQPLACVREHKLLLDAARKAALLGIAGMNRAGAEAARAESFREPADVLPVLGG